MPPRAIRRAAERKANKLARKSAQQTIPSAKTPTQESTLEALAEISRSAILSAAVANANLSASTSPLTGQTALLPTADATEYDHHLRVYQNEYQPVGLQESNLVQSLAETAWRTRRLRSLEMTIYAMGRMEFAEQFAEHNSELRESLLDVHTFLTYEKQLRSLQLQEARLSRRADKERAELRSLQQERSQREERSHREQEEEQDELEAAAQQMCQSSGAEENGFEFSNDEIESYLARRQAAKNRAAASCSVPAHSEAA